MADDTTARLGFEVDSKGLDDATRKLGGLTSEAQKTERAAESLTTKFNGLGYPIKKVGDGFADMAKGVATANKEMEKTAPAVQGMGAAINAAIGKSSGLFADMARSIAWANGAIGQLPPALDKAAAAHARLSTQGQAAFHSLRSVGEQALLGVNPITALTGQINHLSYAASGPQGLTGAFAEVARMIGPGGLVIGGFAALGAASVGAYQAIAKVNDEVFRSKAIFAAIAGSAAGGEQAYSSTKAAAKAAGAEMSSFADAVNKAKQAQDQLYPTSTRTVDAFGNVTKNSVIYADSADRVVKTNTAIEQTFGTVAKVMNAAGSTAEESAKVFGLLGNTLGKTGKLTADTFQSLRDSSPVLARAIADAFNVKNLNEFQAKLIEQPKTITELAAALERYKQSKGQIFDPSDPKTFNQALDLVGRSWHNLIEEMGKAGSFNAGTKLTAGFADAIDSASKFVAETNKVLPGFSGAIETYIVNVMPKAVAAIATLPTSGLTAISNFVAGALPLFAKFAAAAISAAQSAMNALASAIPQRGVNGVNGAGGEDFSSYAGGGFGAGGSDYYSDYGGVSGGANPESVNYGGGSSDYGYFAEGGSFTVAGSGGTDSQQVGFMATPGEQVTIEPPGGSGIEKAVRDGTKQTTQALATIGGIIKMGAVIPGAGNSSSRPLIGGVGTLNGAVGGGGGGGDPFGEIKRQEAEAERRRQQEPTFREVPIWQQSFPMKTGAAGPLLQGPFRSDQSTEEAVKQNTAKTSGKLDAQKSATNETTDAVDSASRAITSSVNDGWSKVSSAIDSGLSNLGAAIASVSPGGGGGYAGPSSVYDAASSYGGGGFYSGGYDGGDYSSSGGGGSGYDGGVPTNDMTGGTGGGFNPGYVDYGGGSADYGYFARGGSFVVGGDGNTDTTPVFFRATRGERVTVTPPGVGVSSAMLNPSMDSGTGGGGARSQNSHGGTHKTVHMHLYGLSDAQSFLKSRAQIARAM